MEQQDIDNEILEEFLNDLREQATIIERALSRLAQGAATTEMQELQRAFHNLKGAAAVCRFEPGVNVTHGIESLLANVQSDSLVLTPLLAEIILLATDRLEQAAGALLKQEPTTHLHLDALGQGLEMLADTPKEEIDTRALRFIKEVSGVHPPSAGQEEQEGSMVGGTVMSDDPVADLNYFRGLAQQLERRSPLFQGRTSRIRQLALSMNAVANKPVDPLQLEAAIYMHDVGMMFLPEPLWLKPDKLSEYEWEQMRLHPGFVTEMLSRMKGWPEAARIVEQHHEKIDGSGYPHGLKDEQICPGAKIVAIVDAFEAVMLKHAYRGQKMSLLRAAAEINGCEHQFASEWVGPFNHIVKKLI